MELKYYGISLLDDCPSGLYEPVIVTADTSKAEPDFYWHECFLPCHRFLIQEAMEYGEYLKKIGLGFFCFPVDAPGYNNVVFEYRGLSLREFLTKNAKQNAQME